MYLWMAKVWWEVKEVAEYWHCYWRIKLDKHDPHYAQYAHSTAVMEPTEY